MGSGRVGRDEVLTFLSKLKWEESILRQILSGEGQTAVLEHKKQMAFLRKILYVTPKLREKAAMYERDVEPSWHVEHA